MTSLSAVRDLRAELKRRKLTAFLVPRQDEFQGEYVAAYAERLKWLTGFAGSWGMAILTLTKGAIFVDGRYTIQVRQQVDSKVFAPHHLIEEPPAAWIGKNLKKGDKLGFDPWLTTAADAAKLAEACAAAGVRFVPVADNPIDAVWKDQPKRPTAALATQPTQLAGKSATDKLKETGQAIGKADAAVLTQPDSVAWLLNLRGFDIPYTPVVPAYVIVHRKGKAELFIEDAKVTEDVRAAMRKVANLHPPKEIKAALKSLGKARATVQIDPAWTPEAIRAVLASSKAKVVYAPDPCTLPKARKNPVEQEGARAAQRRDGAAMVRFLHWLEGEAPKGGLTEISAAARLGEFRQQSEEFRDLSFGSISGAGPNAAIPHYHVTPKSSRLLKRDEIYLIDSGGQYPDGTTDITRTVIVGEPTPQMQDRFTRVLKGMIGVSRIRFPKGTCGSQIDVLARQHLWTAGLDYDHGTGHGVGSYLSVHEGPARINKTDRTPLEPGMILSNEPGFYKQGEYGIRIENLLLVHEAKDVSGGERPMLGFETLTLCPIDRRLIDTRLMNREELQWLDAYHARVLDELSPLLGADDVRWLQQACAPLS